MIAGSSTRQKYWTNDDINKMIRLYDIGDTLQEVADKFNTSKYNVYYWLKKNNCKRRKSRQEIYNIRRKRNGLRKHTAANGYVYVYNPENKRFKRGIMTEHQIVWESSHHKKLPNGWIIHHLNGIRNDNRPQNLMAMPKRSHHWHLVQYEYQKRIRDLEIELDIAKRVLLIHENDTISVSEN